MPITPALAFLKQLLLLLTFLAAFLNAMSSSSATSASAASSGLSAALSQADDEDLEGAFIFNRTTISKILQKFNFLSLYLSDARDFNNNFIRFLIEQKTCALQIFVGPPAIALWTHTYDEVIQQSVQNFKFHIEQQHRAVYIKTSAQLHEVLSIFPSKSGFLICVIDDDFVDFDELKVWTSALWRERGIFKVFYFMRTCSWFYSPFVFNETIDEFGALIDLNTLKSEQQIFKNMNGYVVRTYIFDSVYSSVFGNVTLKEITSATGADSEAALLLSKIMNFTMELQWPDDEFFGARLENGSYDGAIGRILRSETDVIFSGFFVKDYLTREITFTVAVYMDELCCYVMKAPRIPQSILPLFAVRLDIWFGFLLVGLLSPLIWMLIRYWNLSIENRPVKEHGCRRSHYQYARIFIDTWVIWVRVNITRFPPFYSERVFVASLCLVSVIYGALFESSLATVYIRPLYYKDINTLDELNSAGLRIYIKHAAMRDDLFYGHSSLVYQNLERKLFMVGETEERLISMMSKRGGFAAVTRASSLILDDIRYLITKKIHKIPECPKNYHIAFVLPRHSPYEEAFNWHLMRFVEAGLIDQWINVMKHRAKTKIYTFPDYGAETSNHWKVLTLKDLQLSFYALAFGCVFAFLSLSIEKFFRFKCMFLFTK